MYACVWETLQGNVLQRIFMLQISKQICYKIKIGCKLVTSVMFQKMVDKMQRTFLYYKLTIVRNKIKICCKLVILLQCLKNSNKIAKAIMLHCKLVIDL